MGWLKAPSVIVSAVSRVPGLFKYSVKSLEVELLRTSVDLSCYGCSRGSRNGGATNPWFLFLCHELTNLSFLGLSLQFAHQSIAFLLLALGLGSIHDLGIRLTWSGWRDTGSRRLALIGEPIIVRWLLAWRSLSFFPLWDLVQILVISRFRFGRLNASRVRFVFGWREFGWLFDFCITLGLLFIICLLFLVYYGGDWSRVTIWLRLW